MPRNKENKVADTGALTLLGRHRLRGHILYSAQTSLLLCESLGCWVHECLLEFEVGDCRYGLTPDV
jgi:hypothetical protein